MSLISTAVSRLTSRGRSYMVVPSAASVLDMTVDEVYRTQPALRAVVGFLSDNVAQLPLKLYVRESDNNRLRDTTSAAAIRMVAMAFFIVMSSSRFQSLSA